MTKKTISTHGQIHVVFHDAQKLSTYVWSGAALSTCQVSRNQISRFQSPRCKAPKHCESDLVYFWNCGKLHAKQTKSVSHTSCSWRRH